MNKLPPEILMIIFENLSFEDYKNASLVCTSWMWLINRSYNKNIVLNLFYDHQIETDRKFKNVKLKRCFNTAIYGINAPASFLDNITELQVEYLHDLPLNVYSSSFKSLKKLKIEKLNILSNEKVTNVLENLQKKSIIIESKLFYNQLYLNRARHKLGNFTLLINLNATLIEYLSKYLVKFSCGKYINLKLSNITENNIVELNIYESYMLTYNIEFKNLKYLFLCDKNCNRYFINYLFAINKNLKVIHLPNLKIFKF